MKHFLGACYGLITTKQQSQCFKHEMEFVFTIEANHPIYKEHWTFGLALFLCWENWLRKVNIVLEKTWSGK